MNEVTTKKENKVETLPAPAALNPMQLLAVAVERGVDTDQLKQLMELQREWRSDKAREAYVAAMTAFKAEPLRVVKDRTVSYTGTSYTHASLAQVVDACVQAMSRHGLSHRWETKQDGNLITVSCIITHEQGHSERTTLSALPDDSGKKNSIQQIASTVTYLERYTLMAATGLAARDMDNDGAPPAPPAATIDEKQAAELDALMTEVGADRAKFMAYYQIDSLEALPAKSYKTAVRKLEAKRAT